MFEFMIRKTSNQRTAKTLHAKRKFIAPTDAEIAFCAYAIYAKENPERAIELWGEAKAQLIAARQHDAGLFAAPKHFSHN